MTGSAALTRLLERFAGGDEAALRTRERRLGPLARPPGRGRCPRSGPEVWTRIAAAPPCGTAGQGAAAHDDFRQNGSEAGPAVNHTRLGALARQARFRRRRERPLAVRAAEGRSLEFWHVGAGAAPRPFGLVGTEPSRLALPPEAGRGDGGTLAAPVEPRGGSPTGRPTGQVVYSGKPIPE